MTTHPQPTKEPMPDNPFIAQEERILAEFTALPDLDAKYTYLFQLAETLPPLDPAQKTEANRVRGCQSDLWFHLDCAGGKMHLSAESDSLVISGIAALLVQLVEGCRPEEIEGLNLDFIDRLSIWKLPSQRNNSLLAMLEHLKTQARTCLNNRNRSRPNA